jgi:uncharacterized membrane protein
MFLKPLITGVLLLIASCANAYASARPSYACVFTEPFISISSFPSGMHYESFGTAIPVTQSTFSIKDGVVTFTGTLKDKKTFMLMISKEPGSDGMSDFSFPYAGKLSGAASGLALSGGCIKFPDGTTPRAVKNVADNDRLNVRQKPNSKAKIVNSIPPRGLAWAYPDKLVKGWARVSTARYPKNESGDITVIDGWVNAKFLGDR